MVVPSAEFNFHVHFKFDFHKTYIKTVGYINNKLINFTIHTMGLSSRFTVRGNFTTNEITAEPAEPPTETVQHMA